MRLLNDLLNLHDGYDDDGWKKKCRNMMLQTFVREDTFGLIIPAGAATVNVYSLQILVLCFFYGNLYKMVLLVVLPGLVRNFLAMSAYHV
jgi:hypothetical protein